MYINLFGRKYVIVLPYQKFDIRRLERKSDKDGNIDLRLLWVMRKGILIIPEGMTILMRTQMINT